MRFNAKKCHVLHLARTQSHPVRFYQIIGNRTGYEAVRYVSECAHFVQLIATPQALCVNYPLTPKLLCYHRDRSERDTQTLHVRPLLYPLPLKFQRERVNHSRTCKVWSSDTGVERTWALV